MNIQPERVLSWDIYGVGGKRHQEGRYAYQALQALLDEYPGSYAESKLTDAANNPLYTLDSQAPTCDL